MTCLHGALPILPSGAPTSPTTSNRSSRPTRSTDTAGCWRLATLLVDCCPKWRAGSSKPSRHCPRATSRQLPCASDLRLNPTGALTRPWQCSRKAADGPLPVSPGFAAAALALMHSGIAACRDTPRKGCPERRTVRPRVSLSELGKAASCSQGRRLRRRATWPAARLLDEVYKLIIRVRRPNQAKTRHSDLTPLGRTCEAQRAWSTKHADGICWQSVATRSTRRAHASSTTLIGDRADNARGMSFRAPVVASHQSSSSMRARNPDKAESDSSERRTPRFCQNRVALATINTLRLLTPHTPPTGPCLSPSVVRICCSIRRFTAASVSGSDLVLALVLDRVVSRPFLDASRAGPAEGCPRTRPSKPGIRHGAGRGPAGALSGTSVGTDAGARTGVPRGEVDPARL